MTLILITHDMDIASQSDRIVTIKDGQIIRDEKNEHLRSRPADWQQAAGETPSRINANVYPTAAAANAVGEKDAVHEAV